MICEQSQPLAVQPRSCHRHSATQPRTDRAMWEKLRVVFTIPELRQKILLTLAAAGHLSRRLADSAADHRPGRRSTAVRQSARRLGRRAASRWPCSAPAQLEPGHDLRPGHHALHFGLDHLPAAGQRLAAARSSCRRKAKRAARKSTNTPATPRSSSAWSKAGSICGRSSIASGLGDSTRF